MKAKSILYVQTQVREVSIFNFFYHIWTQNLVNRCARYTLLQVIVTIMIIMIIQFCTKKYVRAKMQNL